MPVAICMPPLQPRRRPPPPAPAPCLPWSTPQFSDQCFFNVTKFSPETPFRRQRLSCQHTVRFHHCPPPPPPTPSAAVANASLNIHRQTSPLCPLKEAGQLVSQVFFLPGWRWNGARAVIKTQNHGWKR